MAYNLRLTTDLIRLNSNGTDEMKLTDFYNEVARRVDTEKTSISVAETKRVLSEAFIVLSRMDAAEFADMVSKGVTQAKKKER